MIWEYQALTFLGNERTTGELERRLNEAGEDGWELVSVSFDDIKNLAVMKRPKRV